MAATTIKTDPIKNDKMKFQTQIIDGKAQIFFDAIDDSSTKSKSKRNSRTVNNNTIKEQEKNKTTNKKSQVQNGFNKQTTKTEQSSNKIRVNEDGAALGVYMTMDEIADLVKAVKENAKNDSHPTNNTQIKEQPSPSEQYNETTTTTAPIVPKLDLPVEPSSGPPVRVSPREQVLNMMAEKKRQKWMRERAEIERMQMEIQYDQLKHQLSPRHKQPTSSPERSTFQYDFPPPPPPTISKPPPAPPLPSSLKSNEEPVNDPYKTRLLEKKQQQWKQENSEKMSTWNPFGRPGAGAPNTNENPPRTSQASSNGVVPFRPSISQQQQITDNSSPPAFVHSDQTRVPAAMRTNLLFGDVRFDEDVKTAKELERRQWVEDLKKQVEDNKRTKYFQSETDRRNNFLNENVQPIVQEAANRHHQQQQKDNSIKKPSGSDETRVQQQQQQQHDIIAQQRFGYQQTDLSSKSVLNGKSNETSGEKLFGSTYDSSSKQNTNNKMEPLHLNVALDHQQPYRVTDVRRNEAVNTVDSTFRSDHSVQTDLRIPPNRHVGTHAYEESDLPPQIPNHHYRNSAYGNIPTQANKKTTRMRSLDETHPSRRQSTTTYNSNMNDDRTISQISNQRSNTGPVDVNNRPLWNYRNAEHREYIPNSKRDPHYEKRQRLKHFEQGNFDRIDDVQIKTCYNRWNSDTELQQQHKKPTPSNRVRSTIAKTTSYGGNQKDESIMNLLKIPQKQQQQQNMYGARKSVLNHVKNDDEYNGNRQSSLDRYENYNPYTQPDEIYERPETPPQQQYTETIPNNNNNNTQQREWENSNQQNTYVQPTPYPPPDFPQQSRQEHILQQLSNIKENLVRRQRELATSSNVIPV